MTANSEATENYVKAVYQLSTRGKKSTVSSGEIARRVGVAPATATLMLKRLAESGLVRYEAYSGVSLTRKGKTLALRTVRRHRLIELFLVRTLGMPWDQVHEEAERMEHAVSDQLIDRIDQFLGSPDVDPHGAPIPRDDGSIPERETFVSLGDCEPGTDFVLGQVPDQTPDFLRYLTEVGLKVGVQGHVVGNCDHSGVLNVEIDGEEFAMSRESANSLRVRAANKK